MTTKIVTLTRIIKYKGTEKWLKRTLKHSLNEGITLFSEDNTITIETVEKKGE